MDILLKPDSLCLAGAMNRFLISTTGDISFVLKYAETDAVVVQHTYTPNKQGRVEINLESIVTSLLTFKIQDVSEPYRQTSIVRKFTATFSEVSTSSTESWSFTVLRAGIDRFADSAANWLKANFLTWQPTVKPVTYYTPEFLTYYAQADSVCKCRAYVEKNGIYEETLLTMGLLSAGYAWTIPVQYAIIAGKTNDLPSYYDIWVENTNGERLTYIQRYYASDVRSEQEQWVLFENSLGGIDTFRAYGDSENTAKHTHNIAEIENDSEEYRVDTTREFKKNTGHLTDDERRWLLDFFPSLGKYLYAGTSIRRIVVTESDVNWQAKELPSSYTFTYKYADARPYLNLPRADMPANVLDIKIPDVGSFTVAPRLVELDRLPLSGGALFPVQSPYSDKWSVTTAAAIIDWLSHEITASYSGNGSFGHTHDNMSLLSALTRLGKYLLIDAQKIWAEYADEANVAKKLSNDSPVYDQFLRKDVDDTASGIITFLRGLVARAKSFFAGIKNTGDIENDGNITNTGDITTKNLTVTGKATFFELEILKAKAAGGTTINSPGTFHADLVEDTDAGYVLYQRADQDGKTLMQMVEEGDQLFCCDFNVGTGLYTNAGNRYYWRRVTAAPTEYVTKSINGEEVRYLTVTISKTDRDLSSDDAPQIGDDLMVLGSRTNPDRQSAIMTSAYRSFDVGLTAPYTAQYIGINDYDLASHRRNYQAANGNKFVGRMEIVSNGSEAVSRPVPCERGAWTPGMECGYYDRVSHTTADGTSLWLCLVEPGHTTTDEPGTSDAWRLQVAGTSGKDGTYYFIAASQNIVHVDKDGNADVNTISVYGAYQDNGVIRAITDSSYTLHAYKDAETGDPVRESSLVPSFNLGVDVSATKYIVVLRRNGRTVNKLTIHVIKDGTAGETAFSITTSPGTVIINQSTSKSGNAYPLLIDAAAEGSNTEIVLHVFNGSEEIPVSNPAVGIVGFSINTITPNHCTVTRTAASGTTYNDRVWISGVGTYAENGSNKYYRTGYVDLEVLYGNSIIGIVRAAFACNLNGEFKEVIDRDFSGRYASKTEFNNLSNNAITQSEMESAIEQKSDEILSTVQDVTDGINTQITTIRQTAQSISMKVGEVSERRNMLTGTAFRRLEEISWNNPSYPCMISTSVQYRGTNSVLIDCVAETNADGSAKDKWQGVIWHHIKVTPGKMYQWSFWYRTRTKDLTTEVKAFDANGKELNRPVSKNFLAGTNTDGTWHLFKVNFIPTDGTVTVDAMVYIIYSGKTYVARMMLEEADDYGGWTPSAQDYDYTGGNLIAGSRLFDGDRMSNGASTVTPNGFGEYSSLEINTSWEWKFGDIAKPNTEYIFSCYVNNYGDMTFRLTSGGSSVFAESSDGNVMDSARTDGLVTISAHNKWTRIWVHFKTSANVPSGTRIALRWVTSSNIHQIAAPKLEYGATVTDWTESADDKVSKAALLNTGIDIVNRKIKAIGDMFEWLNNQGEKKVFFDNNTGEYNFSGNVVATTFSGSNGYFKVLPNGASWSTGLINYGNMYLVDGIDDTDILAIHANGIGGAPMISFYYNSTLDNNGNPQYDRITTQSDGGRNMIIAGGASSVSYPMSSQSFGDTDGAGPFIAIGNSSSEINSNRPSNITNTLLNSHLLATPKVLTNRLEAKSIVSNMEILKASKTVGNPGTIYVCKNTSQITINLGSPSSHKGELYIFVRAGNNITFTGTNLSYWNGRTGNSITSTTAHEIIFAICDGAIWHLQTINN